MVVAAFDQKALAALLDGQNNVITYRQALAECRLTPMALRHRTRDGGPWQLLLPGVCVASTGTPTTDQREIAAILYGGATSVITGLAALRIRGVRTPRADTVDVLVPGARQRRDAGFVRLHRTSRMPEMVNRVGAIRYALPPRATADAVRELADIRQARAVVAEVVQRRICLPMLLHDELNAGPRQGSARLRRILAEIADGTRSAPEADLRILIRRAKLPEPMYNPRLFGAKEFIASPDCWWHRAGVAVEVDSREWHLSPQDWERTMARRARMSSFGIIVLHFTPRQIRTEPRAVVETIRATLAATASRPPLSIKALPAL